MTTSTKCWRCSAPAPDATTIRAADGFEADLCDACVGDVAGTLASLRAAGHADGPAMSVDDLFATYGAPCGRDADEVEARLRARDRTEN